MLCSCLGDLDKLKDAWPQHSIYYMLRFWLCPYLCSRQRRSYPRTEPHGTWRNGRVGTREYRLFFVYLFKENAKTSFCFSHFYQSGRLHEHGNISVSVWSSEQTEPTDARQRDAGRSVRPTLLNSTWSFLLCTFCLFFYFFKKKFLQKWLQSSFDGYLYFSGVIFFFLSPMCNIVILNIVKHHSLYIVCTAQLSAHRNVSPHYLCSAFRC